jgi:hypothetical protein
MGGRRTTLVVLAAFVALRLYATVGLEPSSTPDTPTYFVFRWWGGLRFPVMTVPYVLIGNHHAVVTFQAVVGATCWSIAAVLLGPLIERRGYRTAFEIAVLALGLTVPVTRLDNALISESISVSLFVLMAALLIRLSCRPSRAAAIWTLAVGALTVFTRQGNPFTVGLIAVAILVVPVALRPRGFAWKFAGALGAIACAGFVLASSNPQYQRISVAEVLQRRIIGHTDERWFISHGMPANGRAVVKGPLPAGIPRGDALLGDPGFVKWLHADGVRLYGEFVVTHPSYVISTSLHDRLPVVAVITGLGDADKIGSARRVVPRIVEGVFWPRTPAEDLLASLGLIALTGAALASALRRRQVPRGVPMSLTLLGVSVVAVVVVTHTAGHEYPRHLMAVAASTRVVVLWVLVSLLAGSADRTIGRPSATRPVSWPSSSLSSGSR